MIVATAVVLCNRFSTDFWTGVLAMDHHPHYSPFRME
jgi:hypothetical protein